MHNALMLCFAVACILATWIVLSAVLIGVGAIVQRAFRLPVTEEVSPFSAFWIGTASTVAFLQVWNLFFAITWTALAIIIATGALGWMLDRGRLARRAIPACRACHIACVLAALWLALQATGAASDYDTGLYHLSGVRWAKEFPVVPGLGHLHVRLAFNNSSFLLGAMLDTGPWAGRASHVLSGLLLLPLLFRVIIGFFDFMRTGDAATRLGGAFDFLLITPVLVMGFDNDVSSFNPDLSASVVCLSAASILFRILIAPTAGETGLRRTTDEDWLAIAALLGLAVCFKVSAIIFAGSAAAITAWALMRRRQASLDRATRVRIGVAGAVMFFALVIPWCARGVIISGYPLYPSTVMPFAAEWKMSAEQARDLRQVITVFARHYYSVAEVGEPDWIRSWFQSLLAVAKFDVVVPTCLAMLGCASALGAFVARRRTLRDGVSWVGGVLLALASLIAIVFWFRTAPNPRFGAFLFWILAASTASTGLATLCGTNARAFRIAVLACALLPSALLIQRRLAYFVRTGAGGMSIVRAIVPPAGSDHGMHPTPSVPMETFVTSSGLKLHVPIDGDQCWDGSLPCTPYPRPGLRLRRDGDWRSGFVDDGTVPQIKAVKVKDRRTQE